MKVIPNIGMYLKGDNLRLIVKLDTHLTPFPIFKNHPQLMIVIPKCDFLSIKRTLKYLFIQS